MEREEQEQANNNRIRCHYEVLGVERDADDATIKKAHRQLARRLHPDKNIVNGDTHREFLAVQQAYECLSDAVERKWYDDHREAILKGWTNNLDGTIDMLFDVMPYMYAGCYNGYSDDDPRGFYTVYRTVFQQIFKGELSGDESSDYLAQEFGDSQSPWEIVAAFYQAWESFSSTLNYAWVDPYDITQADNRRVRRAMEDENKKARRTAKRTRNEDVAALVHFVKRRDPRVQARQNRLQEQKAAQKIKLEQQEAAKKKEKKQAMEEWRQKAHEEMAAVEEEDRLAGRIRLADLEDDYDYGGKKKGKNGRKKNKDKQLEIDSEDEAGTNTAEDATAEAKDQPEDASGKPDSDSDGFAAATETGEQTEEEEEEDLHESSSSEEEEPDAWRCECCKKDFKSQGQMDNHLKSKKHKAAWKKYEAKLARLEAELMDDMLDELEIEDDAK